MVVVYFARVFIIRTHFEALTIEHFSPHLVNLFFRHLTLLFISLAAKLRTRRNVSRFDETEINAV